MKYMEFMHYVKSKIEECLPLTNKVQVHPILKNNNLKLDALTIVGGGNRMSPVIYIKHYYEQYKSGRELHSIMDEILNSYLLTKPNGEQLYPDTVYNIYRRFMKSHPELRWLSLHKLRHSFASVSVAHNVDIKTLQETLGHSNASVTLDTYSHGYFQNKVKQADLLDNTIFSKNKCVI